VTADSLTHTTNRRSANQDHSVLRLPNIGYLWSIQYSPHLLIGLTDEWIFPKLIVVQISLQHRSTRSKNNDKRRVSKSYSLTSSFSSTEYPHYCWYMNIMPGASGAPHQLFDSCAGPFLPQQWVSWENIGINEFGRLTSMHQKMSWMCTCRMYTVQHVHCI
jgi:hypothetical protein